MVIKMSLRWYENSFRLKNIFEITLQMREGLREIMGYSKVPDTMGRYLYIFERN